MAYLVIIGFVTVLFIMFGNLIFTLKEEAHLTGRLAKGAIAQNLAEAGAAVGLNELEFQLRDPQSQIFREICQLKIDDPSKPAKWSRKWNIEPEDYDVLVELKKEMKWDEMKIELSLMYLRGFPQIEGFRAPDKEKVGVCEVVCSVTYQGVKQIVREQREVKVTGSVFPCASRFTFFLRNGNYNPGTRQNNMSNMLNVVEVDEQGGTGGKQILFCQNGAGGASTNSGWIFLGGGDKPENPVIVNLAGGFTPVGEGFHLGGDIYLNREIPGNPTSNADAIGIYDAGFCKELLTIADPFNSNLKDELEKACGVPNAALSSVIHFFGGSGGGHSPSQTLIMGNVYRSYVKLGVFQTDCVNGRWQNVGIIPWAESKNEMIQHLQNNDSLELALGYFTPTITNPTDQDWELYQKARSEIKVEPYYNSCDASWSASFWEDYFKPKRENEYGSIIPDPAKVPPVKYREYDKSLNNFYANLHPGDDWTKPDYFQMRAAVEINGDEATVKAGLERFLADHLQGGNLNLGMVLYVHGNVTLPNITEITRGGIIVATGDIETNGIDFTNRGDVNKRASSLLTLVSLGGKITLNGPVAASLIALGKKSKEDPIEGTIVSAGNKPYKIFGNFVASKVDVQNIASAGGEIEYNNLLYPDPQDQGGRSYLTNDNCYSVNLSPEVSSWTVSSQ